jgi:hypothetical protein
MDGPQSLAACISALKTLQAEAKQRFGLPSNVEPRMEGLLNWPLRFYVAGKTVPVCAVVSLHREQGQPPYFALRYGEKPDQVALRVFPLWNGKTYVLVVEEPDGGRHPSLRRAVVQLKEIAAEPLQAPVVTRVMPTEALSLL